MSGCPAIVLVVAPHEVPSESTPSVLEAAGFWVARSTGLDAAVADIAELRPDAALLHLDLETRHGDAGALLQKLKSTPATRRVPLIVIERGDAPAPTVPPLGPPDVRLAQPVSPVALEDAVKRALLAARAIRRHNHESRSVAILEPHTRDGSEKPERLGQPQGRHCPACGEVLTWTERRAVDGLDYDYFRWCERGCGLFCFGLSSNRWVKLG